LGVEPDRKSWSVGESRKRPELKPNQFSRWSLSSGLDERTGGISVESHLRALWLRLVAFREQIISTPPEFEKWLVAVAHFDKYDEPLMLSGGHFATASYYGLRLDFDFYFDDDFGHDDLGRSYWDWEPANA
jgi:hypothetical protein